MKAAEARKLAIEKEGNKQLDIVLEQVKEASEKGKDVIRYKEMPSELIAKHVKKRLKKMGYKVIGFDLDDPHPTLTVRW